MLLHRSVVKLDFEDARSIQQRAAVAVRHAFGIIPLFVCEFAQN